MKIKDVADQYGLNLIKAASITGLGQQIVDISVQALEGIERESQEHTTKQKLTNHISVIKNLYNSPILGELIPTISGQQIVLTVSAFEVFMSDLVRCIGNDYRNFISWPDGSSGKIDLSLLNSNVATIGDLVLHIIEQQNISFQDLQATKRFLSSYLSIDFSLSGNEEEDFILACALRNALVHAGGAADPKFMKQIRNTRHYSSYEPGQNILVSNEQAKSYMQTFRKAGSKIYTQIETRIGVNASG